MRWLRQWGPAVAWAAVIFALSSQSFSASATSRFILPLLRWLFPHAPHETLAWMHFLIRKSAHFTEYFVFSLLVLRGIRGERKGWALRWALATVAVVACYAVLDEVHQAFVPQRTASPYDSMLDTSGAIVAQILAWMAHRWHSHRAAQPEPGPQPTPGS